MKNALVLGASTVIYFLLYFGGVLKWFGDINFWLSLFIFWLFIPFWFGYFTQKYLNIRASWSPLLVLLVPLISDIAWFLYDGIKSNWSPMEKVPLLIWYLVIPALFVLLGAYLRFKLSKGVWKDG
jgi:peptidoglycan/LPS O-acetylase OafA/YrhL